MLVRSRDCRNNLMFILSSEHRISSVRQTKNILFTRRNELRINANAMVYKANRQMSNSTNIILNTG